MSWTLNVVCPGCRGNIWRVRDSVRTCVCGKVMSPKEIKPYHDELDRIERARKAAEEAAKAAEAVHAPVA